MIALGGRMRKVERFARMWVGICMALACLINPTPPPVESATLPPGFSESVVFSGLTEPTVVRFSPDGRVFVAEKSGLIKVFSNLSDTSPTIFHDLRTNVHNYWDRGLLGLALHPNFPTVPEVYVLYTYDKDPNNAQFPRWGTPGATSDNCPTPPGPTNSGCVVSGRLSRLKASPGSNVSDGSELVLVQGWGQQYPSHTIGTVQFGPDGALYASGGDGASFTFTDYGQKGSPLNPLGDSPVSIGELQTAPTAEGGATRSQSLRRVSGPALLNGTIIRVDPSSGLGLPDNPLFGSTDPNARRIVGYGLRNPFRFTFRPGTPDLDLWIGDVGRNTWEEINRLPNPLASSVRNFGWPCYEGPLPETLYDALNLNICETLYTQAGGHSAPYFAYRHDQAVVANDTCTNSGSSSITGLAFNESASYPAAYQGTLFFADYSRNCIWAMFAGSNGLPDPASRATFVADAAAPVHLQIGPGGDLFYVDLTGGTIRRIQFTSGNQPPKAIMKATPTSGPAPLNVVFSSAGSSDPDGDPITYSWNFGDGGTSTDPNPSHTYTRKGPFTAVLTVTDSKGAFGKDQAIISPGNSKPTAVIDTPVSTIQWKVDQSIAFSGHATDPEDGTLPPSAFTWELIMHHCPSNCHTHSIQSFSSITTGSFSAPDHEYPSHLELKLTVTDTEGLTDTKSVILNPQTVALRFDSTPSQLQLVVGGSQSPTPFTTNVILGSVQSLSAVTPQALGSTTYKFVSWSDGGDQSHTITANATKTYTASYEATSDPVPSPPPSDNSGGGGCTLNRSGTNDALLPVLFLTVIALLLLRGKRPVNKN